MMAHLHMRPSEPKPSPKPVSAYCSTFGKQGSGPANELSKRPHLATLREVVRDWEDEERMGFVMPGFNAPHQPQAEERHNRREFNRSPDPGQKRFSHYNLMALMLQTTCWPTEAIMLCDQRSTLNERRNLRSSFVWQMNSMHLYLT